MRLFIRICMLFVHSFFYFYISDGPLIYMVERYGTGELKCSFIERIFKYKYSRYYIGGKRKGLFFLMVWVVRIGSIIHVAGFLMALLSAIGFFDLIMIDEIASFYIETDFSVFILTSWLLGADILIEVIK